MALPEEPLGWLDSYNRAHFDQPFRYIVRMGLVAQALAVLDEDGETPNHAERLVMAKRILGVPNNGFLEEMTERAAEILALAGLDASDEFAVNQAIIARSDQISLVFGPA